jgi:peptidoglycan/LPS O-acetylase OafA/YrhL
MNVGESQYQQHREQDASGARDGRIYIPTLDGWRALAIIAVICFHGRFVFFPHPSLVRSVSDYGYLGVDAFFAISGFLISNLLIREYAASQSISLKSFYIRRCFRIIPPYMAALAGIFMAAWLGLIQLERWEIPSCLLFLRNYEPTAAPPGGPYDPYGFYTVHFWSLSLEEHFYLIWAPLLALLKPRRAVRAALILAFAVLLWRSVDGHYRIMQTLMPMTEMGTRTDSRLDALLWGCMAALSFPYIKRIFTHRFWSWAWIPLALYLVVLQRYRLPLLHLQLALLFPCLLMSTVLFPRNALGWLLELPFMRWIGTLSYSIYLWQQLFLQPPRGLNSLERMSGFYRLQQFPWNIVCILICASASHYLLERPMMRLGRRLSRSWTSVRPITPDRALPVLARRTQPAFHVTRFHHLMSTGGNRSSDITPGTASMVVERRGWHLTVHLEPDNGDGFKPT